MEEMELITKDNNSVQLNSEISLKIANFEKQVKAIKEAEDKLKAQILEQMEKHNITKLDTQELTITYVAPTYRETFDSKKLRADDEELYNKYISLSSIKSSIRIKVK